MWDVLCCKQNRIPVLVPLEKSVFFKIDFNYTVIANYGLFFGDTYFIFILFFMMQLEEPGSEMYQLQEGCELCSLSHSEGDTLTLWLCGGLRSLSEVLKVK